MAGNVGFRKVVRKILILCLFFTFSNITAVQSQSISDVQAVRDAVDKESPALYKNNPDQFIQNVAERLFCKDNKWGRKKASPTRPISIDTVAYDLGGGKIHIYDLIFSAGDPGSRLQLLDVGVSSQTFVPVSANCSAPPPPPGPDPIDTHDEDLRQIREDVARIRYLLEQAGKRLGIQ